MDAVTKKVLSTTSSDYVRAVLDHSRWIGNVRLDDPELQVQEEGLVGSYRGQTFYLGFPRRPQITRGIPGTEIETPLVHDRKQVGLYER